MRLTAASRSSALAKVQVREVLEEIACFHPELSFDPIFVETYGDKDQKTSLRTLNKTDFFTKEVDLLLLQRHCRIAIHSAKDLPDPLTKGLSIAAITKGVDATDALVIPFGQSLDSLPQGALIATCSLRREQCVKTLRPDLAFTDLRGTIEKRLEHLSSGLVHGVVVAEAALIRLELTHLNRIHLPGETAKYQGQLAVVVRAEDHEMLQLFSKIDVRK